MKLTPGAYALLGLTAIVAALATLVTYALLRFITAAREVRSGGRRSASDQTAMLSAALQEAVTKLKAQERATAARAEASERLSGEIISSLTAGLLVVDLKGGVRILNPAGERTLGVPGPLSAERGRQMPRVAPLFAAIDECLSTKHPISRRALMLPANGRNETHLGVTVSPLFDDVGELHGAICLFTDLTAVKDLEDQLRLKDSLATVGELTAGIAHEFRNGLATIHGYSKLFDLQALPEAYRAYVEGIRAEAESLGQVVTNFLNFARPAQLVLSRVDVHAICERAAEEVRGDARAAGGDVEVRGTFGDVEGDEVLLRQAFSNLLRNALEACASASKPPHIVIQSNVDAAHGVMRIAVNDNGPGIDPGLRDRVFRPFYTSKRNGTGLGLALVQKIIVFHNGRIAIGTSPDKGASLQVTLPAAS